MLVPTTILYSKYNLPVTGDAGEKAAWGSSSDKHVSFPAGNSDSIPAFFFFFFCLSRNNNLGEILKCELLPYII